jgi:hypothetical protein
MRPGAAHRVRSSGQSTSLLVLDFQDLINVRSSEAHFAHITASVIDLLSNTCKFTARDGLSLTLTGPCHLLHQSKARSSQAQPAIVDLAYDRASYDRAWTRITAYIDCMEHARCNDCTQESRSESACPARKT